MIKAESSNKLKLLGGYGFPRNAGSEEVKLFFQILSFHHTFKTEEVVL